MKTIGLIPARMSSSRFPGKPLNMIAGKELLLRVYENASNSKLIDTLYIATCDESIKERIISLGCNVIMTGKHHERCTSRCAEALVKIESIDMLRLIENKILIKAKLLKYKTQAVDVLSDINKVESIILNE